MATPTANEQYMLELINRARLDPAGEAARYGINLNKGLPSKTISEDPKQPLAMNPDLLDAARDHSTWMLNKDVFSHTGASGSSAGDRMRDAGYSFSGSWVWGENISWRGTTGSLDLTNAIRQQHKGLFLSSGHRENLMNGAFREVGVAQVEGVFTDGVDYNASMVTQNFAKSGSAVFVTGAIYDDNDGDDFYSVGEGDGGVAVTANGSGTTSYGSGGYQVKAPKGFVTVTFDGSMTIKVDTTNGNAKVDLVDGDTVASSADLKLVSGIKQAHLLGVGDIDLAGSDASDRLDGNDGKNKLVGQDGDDRLNGGAGKDTLKGGPGNDILKGGKGKDTLKGGPGADKLVGGKGNDSLKGGNNTDTFVFTDKMAVDTVKDFDPGTDLLDFTDHFGTAKKALAAAEKAGSKTVFDLGGGDKVKLNGVAPKDLAVEDFI
ncbi:CAP domain-containing protein [Bauldia sp.]|uniref:CAP domain-containing protein n=1 Tax=Bauldia sp. TaxID=2575872 RepID=UPI003BAAF6C5